MALVKTTSKMVAIRAFINEWIKDPTFYCGNCLTKFNPHFHVLESCCENPQFGRNIDHTRAVIKDNIRIKKDLLKGTGANKDNTFRCGVNLPPQLYHDLTAYFKSHGEKLFNEPKELRDFMNTFKMFTIPDKV